MLKKRLVILVFLILASSVFALNSDFNNDGKVDYDDFFLFADNYQKNVNKDNEKFDIDKNKRIDVEDFFIFAEEFEKSKESKSKTGLAKTGEELAGDFDGSGCVDNKDFETAKKELFDGFNLRGDYAIAGDYSNEIKNYADKANADKIKILIDRYDLNNDGFIFSEDIDAREIGLAKKDLEIFNKGLGRGCATGGASTKPIDLKLLRAYHFNYENFRNKETDFLEGSERKYRLKVNADDVIKNKDTFEFSDEEYEAIAREDGFVAQSLGTNTILFVFQAPNDAKQIIINYVLKSGHEVGYGVYLYPKFQDGFDTYAYKVGETRINFNGYGTGNGELKLEVENGKAYLITTPLGKYYYFIDRVGVV